jgi:4-hydroxy-tetrahydrodipicolinate synthase
MAGAENDPAFHGVFTALVSPFQEGEVDPAALEALVERQIEAGVHGLVPCGSTGESATLTRSEHDRIIETVTARAAGRCKVLAGTGTGSTTETVDRCHHAASAGVDGVLVVTPYYVRPTQEGLFRHYAAVAEAVELPIVLYNVPSRCGVDLANETVVRLREKYAHIVALKDASGNAGRTTDLAGRSDISVLSGDDVLTLPLMAEGAVGVISVLSNLVPAWLRSLVETVETDLPKAREWHRRVCRLAADIGGFGPNPVPIKTAMAVCGLIPEEFRLPLCPLGQRERELLGQALRGRDIEYAIMS